MAPASNREADRHDTTTDLPGPPEPLGALLTRLRQDRGRTQLRIADMLCAASGVATVTRHEISRWEREKRLPTGPWLRWLALVLEVPLDDLERAAAVSRRHRDGSAARRRGQPAAEPPRYLPHPRAGYRSASPDPPTVAGSSAVTHPGGGGHAELDGTG